MKVGFYGSHVWLPACYLRSLVKHVSHQRAQIVELRARLEARETLLHMTLHELAIERGESEPRTFVYQRVRHRNTLPGSYALRRGGTDKTGS